MNFTSLANKRRSIRAYTDTSVSDNDLAAILEAARTTPSAGNCQPWHIFVIRDAARRTEIVSAVSSQEFIATAPVLLVICADIPRVEQRYGERGRNLYSIQDTAAMIQNILLCAADLNLGTCWIGAFDEAKLSEKLNLSPDMRPVAMIPVGHPAGEPGQRAQDRLCMGR